MNKSKMTKTTKGAKRTRPKAARHWCFTCHDTRYYKVFKKLDLAQTGIRYMVYQLEEGESTLKRHLQGYVVVFILKYV